MKLSTGLLLPALATAASAISDANVYIFEREGGPSHLSPPTLTPNEARLVFAERLGVSQYHGLGDATESALSYINRFGGQRDPVLGSDEDRAELVLIVEGISSKTEESLLNIWGSKKPAFKISNPPAQASNLQLIQDLQSQLESSTAGFDVSNGNAQIQQVDMGSEEGSGDASATLHRLVQHAESANSNTMVVLMPASKRATKISKAYGSYEVPAQAALHRRQHAEALISGKQSTASSSSSPQSMQSQTSNSSAPITGVPAVCYASLGACRNATNTCSGHGDCYKKWSASSKESCFACQCTPTEEHFLEGESKTKAFRINHWGGAACQKKDVSGPFWLLAIFTIVMMGLVGWAIGMLFSVGEEKLPGVIGAGVSSKTR